MLEIHAAFPDADSCARFVAALGGRAESFFYCLPGHSVLLRIPDVEGHSVRRLLQMLGGREA